MQVKLPRASEAASAATESKLQADWLNVMNSNIMTFVCFSPLSPPLRSNCPELEKYNLKNQEGGQARGREVASCRQRVEELKGLVNDRLDKLKSSRTVRWGTQKACRVPVGRLAS